MEDNTQQLSPDIKKASLSTSESTVSQPPQASQSPSHKKYKKFLVVTGILLGFVAFGTAGYLLGIWRSNQTNKTNTAILPTSSPATALQSSPTDFPEVDSNTRLLEPNLVSTAGWKTMLFSQNVIVNQGGESRQAHIELKIPPNWSSEAIKAQTDEQIGGVICKDIKVANEDGTLTLLIRPDCGGSSPDFVPIAGIVQKVELTTNKGNDGHDSYSVRYYNSTNNVYHYGSIGVFPGASIDIQKDKIYPFLTLQYEPDRSEQWLWTSHELIYKGSSATKKAALSNADTIISTLKLTD